MPGIHALKQIQLGKETTLGDAATPTALWRGLGSLEDQLEIVFPDEHIGILSQTERAYIPKNLAALSMASVEATFEQFPYICEAGIEAETPTQDGAGTDYIYAYNFPTTGQRTPNTYNILGGDNINSDNMPGAYVDAFTLEGKPGEAWMVSADWIGQKITPGTAFEALAVPTVEEMLFSKTKLYIDSDTNAFGTTQLTGVLLGAKLEVGKTGFVGLDTADGDLIFNLIKQVMPEINLEITFEHDTTPVAQRAFWQAATPQLVRLICEGSAVTTPGTTYSVLTMILDLPVVWEKFEPLGESDGDSILAAKGKVTYNAAAAAAGKITIVNELATLT